MMENPKNVLYRDKPFYPYGEAPPLEQIARYVGGLLGIYKDSEVNVLVAFVVGILAFLISWGLLSVFPLASADLAMNALYVALLSVFGWFSFFVGGKITLSWGTIKIRKVSACYLVACYSIVAAFVSHVWFPLV